MSTRNGFRLPLCPLALSRKGQVSSTTNCMAWRRVVSSRQPVCVYVFFTLTDAVSCASSPLLRPPQSRPRSRLRSHPRPLSHIHYCSRFHPRSRPRSHPESLVSTPIPVPAPDLVRSFPSLGPGYPLRAMRVYRPRALQTELSCA